ncbi:MAG: hypothetical protein VW600_01810, partial [Ferrovibrio sp.]
FTLVCIAWIFFRASSAGDAWMILGKIATGKDGWNGLSSRLDLARNMLIVIGLLACEWAAEYNARHGRPRPASSGPGRVFFVLALIWLILAFGAFSGSEFVYFQF